MIFLENMTAKISAFSRAYHSKKVGEKIFDDTVAEKLLGEGYNEVAEAMLKGADFFLPGNNSDSDEKLRLIVDKVLSPLPLSRAAWAENALENELRFGTSRYLILGAGYDTFAYRRAELANRLAVFEADTREMSLFKQERLKMAGIDTPPNVHFVGADFTKERIDDCLKAAGFNVTERSFCSMLGLVHYLPEQALGQVFFQLSELLCTGSTVAFDYPTLEISESSQAKLAQGAGQEMKHGYSYARIEKMLEEAGFLIYEHLTPSQVTERFFTHYNSQKDVMPMSADPNACFVLACRREC